MLRLAPDSWAYRDSGSSESEDDDNLEAFPPKNDYHEEAVIASEVNLPLGVIEQSCLGLISIVYNQMMYQLNCLLL